MNVKRTLAFSKKEVFHILRDPFTLGLAIMLPLILVVFFGLAIELNVSNIRVAVFDNDKSISSRQVTDIMGSSKFFLPYYSNSPSHAVKELDSNAAKVALFIDHSFEQNISSGKQAHIQALLDASDSSTISSTIGYLNSMQSLINRKVTGAMPVDPVKVKTRFLYNPELNSRWFIVPGLVVIILAILSILLTALTIAREWENGSMELLLSTPATAIEIIVGKLAPYVALGLTAVASVYLISRILLGVPFQGSHLIFLAGCFLFLLTCLSLGLLISVLTRDQRMAMQISLIVGMLPSILLSGFIFPVESMVPFFQVVTAILPARWFLNICRDSFLKGPDFISQQTSFMALLIMSTLLVLLASKTFKRDVEP